MKDIIESLPDNWKVMKFRQIFSLRKGLSITKEDLLEEGCPVISYGQVHSKENTGIGINQTLIRFVSEKYLYTDKISIVEPGDFIFADTSEDTDGVGNCVFVDFKSTLFAGYHTIIVHPTILECYPLYFAFLFLTDFWRANLRAKVMGVKVFSITQKLLRETFVILPPVYEQRAIADFLDKECAQIDSIAADLEKQIALLQQYKKSLITETVTKGLDKSVPMKDSGIEWIGKIPAHWNFKRLKFMLENGSDSMKVGPFGSALSGSDFTDEGKWVYNQRVVLDNNFSENTTFISEEKFQEMRSFAVYPGDILITTRGTIGKVAIVPEGANEGILHPCIIKFRVDKAMIIPELLQLIFNESDFVKDQFVLMSNATTIEVIYSYSLKDILLPVIPSDEQKKIYGYLSEKCIGIDGIIAEKQKAIVTIIQHKKSLIYEYVTGKKRVKGVQ